MTYTRHSLLSADFLSSYPSLTFTNGLAAYFPNASLFHILATLIVLSSDTCLPSHFFCPSSPPAPPTTSSLSPSSFKSQHIATSSKNPSPTSSGRIHCILLGISCIFMHLCCRPLDSKEIQPVHPKRDQSWVFIGRTDLEAEARILWPPDVKS